MNISKTFKILIGIGTIWFAIYPFLFMGMVMLFMGIIPIMPIIAQSLDTPAPFFFSFFGLIFPVHLCTMSLGFALMVFYLIHVIKNTKADETVRIILGVGCFFFSFIVMPVYYYLYIWLDIPPEWAAAKVRKAEE